MLVASMIRNLQSLSSISGGRTLTEYFPELECIEKDYFYVSVRNRDAVAGNNLLITDAKTGVQDSVTMAALGTYRFTCNKNDTIEFSSPGNPAVTVAVETRPPTF